MVVCLSFISFFLLLSIFLFLLASDYESDEEVNKQLDKVGYNIGVRLIEDFLARTNATRCHDLRETADQILRGFKMFLSVSPSIGNFTLTIYNNLQMEI